MFSDQQRDEPETFTELLFEYDDQLIHIGDDGTPLTLNDHAPR
jgi:hypothetical protein